MRVVAPPSDSGLKFWCSGDSSATRTRKGPQRGLDFAPQSPFVRTSRGFRGHHKAVRHDFSGLEQVCESGCLAAAAERILKPPSSQRRDTHVELSATSPSVKRAIILTRHKFCR